jgi:hypothetical protein
MVWKPAASSALSPATVGRAMRLSAVYACLRLLSEAISTLPTDTFYRQNGVRKPYRPRPGVPVFQPPQGNRIDYLSQVMLSLLTDGNAYVLTPRDATGIPVDLIVPRPDAGQRPASLRRLHYDSLGQNLDPTFDIMHIKGMCLPGAGDGCFADRLCPRNHRARPRRAGVRGGVLQLRRSPVGRHRGTPGKFNEQGRRGSGTLGTRATPASPTRSGSGCCTTGRSSTRSRSSRTTHSSSRPGPSRCRTSPGSTASLRT